MILELLEKISTLLELKNIPYMLSGSLALNVYSVPRMTLDIDIVIVLHDKNLDEFLDIFKGNYYINNDTVIIETKRHGMFNVIDNMTGIKIDFILRKETEYRELEFSRRKKERIGDFEAWIVSPEDLILSKLEWIQILQSDKQIKDIEKLLTLPGLDINYIREWCSKLNLKTFELI